MVYARSGSFCNFLPSILKKLKKLFIYFFNKNCIFKQHDKISCLCTFLYASIKIQALPTITSAKQQTPKLKQIGKSISKTSIQDIKSILFDLNDLKEAIQFAACKSYLRTLLNSLRIFLPVNYSINHFVLFKK